MIRSITQLHENVRLVSAAQTPAGRLLVWLVAILLLAWHHSNLLMFAAFSLVMLWPLKRRVLLSLAAAGMIIDGISHKLNTSNAEVGLLERVSDVSTLLQMLGAAVAVLGLLYVFYLVVMQHEKWPSFVRRFPLITLHGGFWICLTMAKLPLLAVFNQLPFLAWRLSYLVNLAARGKTAGSKFHDHLFYLMPVFGGSNTPYGKGLDFLSRHEAHDPAAIARSQLAGIKLMILAILWYLLRDLMDAALFGVDGIPAAAWLNGWSFGLPRLSELLMSETNALWLLGWEVIFLELIRATLSLAAFGHVIVGSLRLLGFNVFRNTYKPLLSESVLEFWNRYYFYFKELLVEFFFYPTYLRLRSASPRLRLFAAVFAAAFLGNMYYHLLTRPGLVVSLDFEGLWATWGPRLVYCFLLAFGIWVSMLRQQEQRQARAGAGTLVRIRRIAGVWIFYAIIQIWNVRLTDVTIPERMDFFISLFGF
jgi:hypothetical protein